MTTPNDLYDALPYPGRAFPQSHPGRVAAQAVLRGLRPAPVETARVLELGCGDGGNLVPMAHGLPQAAFTGIDLNEQALARGRTSAATLGLANVELRQGDLETLDPATLGGPFDYVIAHGVYSWVSPLARDRLLTIAGACLRNGGATDGIAYVSYNAKPGGHLRQAVRELMQLATRYTTDPHEIVARARRAVRLVAEAQQPGDVYGAFLEEYLAKVLERSDAGVFHDDLETWNDAVYLEEIVAHGERHDLRYLAEAELHESSFGSLPPSVEEALDELEPRSEVEQEQQLDFLRLRMYRQTLFTRTGTGPVAAEVPHPGALDGLHAYSSMRPTTPRARVDDESLVEFEARDGSKLKTDHPPVKQAFATLSAAWPGSRPVVDLLDSGDPDAVRQALLGGHAANLVQLSTHAPAVASRPAARPRAGAVARAQIAAGADAVTNLKHEHIVMGDELGRDLIALLDGSRDHAQLTTELADRGAGADAAKRLEASLARLADLALLEPGPD